MSQAKKYNNIRLTIGISKGLISFILIIFFVESGLSLHLENYLAGYVTNIYLLFLTFVFVTAAASSILFFPVNFYKSFYLEHKYNLSNQTFAKYVIENLKSLAISLVIGIPVLLFFFYVLNSFRELWWLPFAVGLFILSVVLARIVPIVILPLFYKITPLDDEDLKLRIQKLAGEAGIKLENVYKFNMSKNTKKANAAFTGIGKSKRILLGDTLLDSYSNDEIETVIAHELGHYKHKHIIKNLIIGTVSSFFTLFLVAYLYRISLPWFGFTEITKISALPVLSVWGIIIGLIQNPISNIISRKYEYEADRYAVKSTHNSTAFVSALEKLTEQNLGDKEPHPFIEWFFYSHPSIKNRIDAVNKYSEDQKTFIKQGLPGSSQA
jgi:STE24 endopeptidase